VNPPRYTGHPERRSASWDLTAEEGATVTWRVTLSRSVESAALVTTEGDTIALRPGGGNAVTGSATPSRSAIYQLVLRDRAQPVLQSEYHRLAVERDQAPTVTVLSPAERVDVAAGTLPVIPVRVRAGDDYGITTTEIVATLTSGQGEQVRFREQRLSFTSTSTTPGPGLALSRGLDLRHLGLGPGDQLYFYVLVRDNRAPAPQETRSETHFITIADTAHAEVATLTGVSLRLAPEYFRSQRQIIIDTEKLLADRPRISLGEFRDRSHNIGVDQELLRLRYGDLVGEENEGGDLEGPPTAESLTHQHDIEDNATRLAGSVKATLKEAVAAMWDAALHLKTFDPAAALPYEYRALDFLKQVQQAARVYVQRVGFEPPPLEPDRKRLTGKLTGIPALSVVPGSSDSTPASALGPSLEVLDRAVRGEVLGAADGARLRAAGTELSRRAVDDPVRFFPALEGLRRLIAAADSGGSCPACAAPALRGIWSALPPPEPAGPLVGPERSVGATAYLEALEPER
jgi:hypothetical protein